MTLTEFLLARITEDEAVAREAREHEYSFRVRDASPFRWKPEEAGYARLIATPARVLAECDAKRRIVAAHRCVDISDWVKDPPPSRCGQCRNLAMDRHLLSLWPCPTIRALGLPYADHPDYRQEWRP